MTNMRYDKGCLPLNRSMARRRYLFGRMCLLQTGAIQLQRSEPSKDLEAYERLRDPEWAGESHRESKCPEWARVSWNEQEWEWQIEPEIVQEWVRESKNEQEWARASQLTSTFLTAHNNARQWEGYWLTKHIDFESWGRPCSLSSLESDGKKILSI